MYHPDRDLFLVPALLPAPLVSQTSDRPYDPAWASPSPAIRHCSYVTHEAQTSGLTGNRRDSRWRDSCSHVWPPGTASTEMLSFVTIVTPGSCILPLDASQPDCHHPGTTRYIWLLMQTDLRLRCRGSIKKTGKEGRSTGQPAAFDPRVTVRGHRSRWRFVEGSKTDNQRRE